MKACQKCATRYPDESTYCFLDGAGLEPLADPRIGSAIAGRYVLESVIGEGGMATVYRAHHKLLDQPFAVKIMNGLLARDPIVRERFRREAKSAKKIAHPNIIEIFEEGDTSDGTAYMVMELLEGTSLADMVAQGPIEPKRAFGLMIQMARGIARAHDFGVIHRDLKPENIFICKRSDDQKDLVKLLDFGIALSKQDSRLTGTGELFGTPQYMAPERITGNDAGASADLYALGIIFFEMLTGRLPFDAPDIASFFVRHLKDAPINIRTLMNVPESLADLIERLLAKNPKNRPLDAHKVSLDLVDGAKEIGAVIPREAQDDPESIRSAALAVSESAIQQWERRAKVLSGMLELAYGAAPPQAQSTALEKLTSLATRVAALKKQSMKQQHDLEEINARGREKRSRLGFAVDALGVDASRAREELRMAEEDMDLHKKQTAEAQVRFKEAHREITRWEGRSGFAEPWTDLAAAYREAADVVDDWRATRDGELKVAEGIEKRKTAVSDLEFQIAKLRESLAQHEREIEETRDKAESGVGAMTREIDKVEEEMLLLATRLTEPLRGRPELSPFFRDLEAA